MLKASNKLVNDGTKANNQQRMRRQQTPRTFLLPLTGDKTNFTADRVTIIKARDNQTQCRQFFPGTRFTLKLLKMLRPSCLWTIMASIPLSKYQLLRRKYQIGMKITF